MLSTALMCLALNVYHETRGSPMSEGYAVSHVVLNRVAHDRWPDDICSVVKQGYSKGKHKCQFSWYCDGKPDTPYEKKAWALSQLIAQDVLDGTVPDNTGGATGVRCVRSSSNWHHYSCDCTGVFHREQSVPCHSNRTSDRVVYDTWLSVMTPPLYSRSCTVISPA